MLYSINSTNSIACLLLLCEILGNMCTTIVCKPGCDAMNFKIKLIFLIKPFFLHDLKVTKTEISSERKELLRWNKKAFFIISKGFSIKQITHFFLEGESPTLKMLFYELASLLYLWCYPVKLLNFTKQPFEKTPGGQLLLYCLFY